MVDVNNRTGRANRPATTIVGTDIAGPIRQGADTEDRFPLYQEEAIYFRTAIFNGAASANAPSVLSTTTGIDGKVVANTALYTVPAGKTLIVTGFVVRATASTAITVGATLGFGNVAGTNNISAAAASGVNSTTTTYQIALNGSTLLTVAAGVVYLNLTNAATGTSQTLACDLIGYLI